MRRLGLIGVCLWVSGVSFAAAPDDEPTGRERFAAHARIERGPSRHARPSETPPPASSRGASSGHVRPGSAPPPPHHAPPPPHHVSPSRPTSPPPHHAPPRHASPPPERYSHRYAHVRPYHGVFVYGPRPHHHDVYADRRDVRPTVAHMPERKLDRDDSLAVGIGAGSIIGGYDSAAPFADPGVGAAVRWRPDEAVGLEGRVATYGMSSDDSARQQTLVSGSIEVFAFPWSNVSPYVLAGVSADARALDDAVRDTTTDQISQISRRDATWGPHVGAGVELALGKAIALDAEARYMGFIGAPTDDPTLPGAFSTQIGVMVHF